MKFFLPILCWFWPCLLFSQIKDTLFKISNNKPRVSPGISNSTTKNFYKPEILTSGFIDIINNGQVNASARFIRLFIGEPGKFAVPLSIYSGVSSNSFQNQLNSGSQRSNEQLINSFINPLSGLVNISSDGIIFFRSKEIKFTRTGFLYHQAIRILTGYKNGPVSDPSTGKPINFLNGVGAGGLYFQTGAWERGNAKNVGVFWFAGRYIICKSGKKQLKDIFPDPPTNGFYHGWSLGWGVEINNLVNIKAICYKYVKRPGIDRSQPIYQFSFNYSLR